MTTKLSQADRSAWVGLALGDLEGEEHPSADLQGIREALEAGGELLPFVVAEIGVGGACGDDEEVERHLAIGQDDNVAGWVDGLGVGEEHLGVGLAAENAADRAGDVGGVQGRGGDLVKQGLEQVMILAVDDRHLDLGPPQRLRGRQAGESAAQDHDARTASRGGRRRALGGRLGCAHGGIVRIGGRRSKRGTSSRR